MKCTSISSFIALSISIEVAGESSAINLSTAELGVGSQACITKGSLWLASAVIERFALKSVDVGIDSLNLASNSFQW